MQSAFYIFWQPSRCRDLLMHIAYIIGVEGPPFGRWFSRWQCRKVGSVEVWVRDSSVLTAAQRSALNPTAVRFLLPKICHLIHVFVRVVLILEKQFATISSQGDIYDQRGLHLAVHRMFYFTDWPIADPTIDSQLDGTLSYTVDFNGSALSTSLKRQFSYNESRI